MENIIQNVLESIKKRHSPEYNSPSGAFFEYLQTLAKNRDLTSFATACDFYISSCGLPAAFFKTHTTSILVNSYFTVLSNFDYHKFRKWSLSTPGWANDLKDNFRSPGGLQNAVNKIIQSVNSYEPYPETKNE